MIGVWPDYPLRLYLPLTVLAVLFPRKSVHAIFTVQVYILGSVIIDSVRPEQNHQEGRQGRFIDVEVDVVALVSAGPPPQTRHDPHHNSRQNEKGRNAEHNGHQDRVRLLHVQRRHLPKRIGTRLRVVHSGSWCMRPRSRGRPGRQTGRST